MKNTTDKAILGVGYMVSHGLEDDNVHLAREQRAFPFLPGGEVDPNLDAKPNQIQGHEHDHILMIITERTHRQATSSP